MAAGKPSDRITCPHCQGSLKAPPLPPGSLCTCPKCGQAFPIGGAGSAPRSAPEASAPATPAPASKAVPKPQPTPKKPKPPVIDAPVQAELADPRPAASSTAPQPADIDQEHRLKALLSAPAVADHQALTATQPAHQQAPPPPKPAAPPRPKHAEIPVVCKLCGTRMHARPEQVGTSIRCPDCHSDNEVIALPEKTVLERGPRPAAPVSLDHAGDFTLSDPVQRPTFRAATSAPASAPAGRGTRATINEMVMTVPDVGDDDDGEEVVVSPPVERIDVKEIVKLPPPDDPNEDNQYRGRFRDDEWGFAADPRQKDAWKKSPFYYGILGFPLYPQTLYRGILYSVIMTVDLGTLLVAASMANSGELITMIGALGFTVFSSVVSVFLIGGGSPCLMAIAQDTANGYDQVEHWPDWNIAEWLISALTIPAAALLASLPGALAASGFISMGGEALLLVPFPIVASELLFFPIIFGSMLAEGSWMPISGSIFRSMQRRGDGWLLFYMASILLGMVLVAAVSLVEFGIQAGTVLVAPIAAVMFVTTFIVYFRLLGRLLWYVQNYERVRDKPE